MGRSAVRVAAAALVALLGPGAVPAAAHTPSDGDVVAAFDTVRLVPAPGSLIEFDGRRYRGEIEISSAGEGLVVIEHTDLDGYLEGIAEVPFSWPAESLAAQAVAARTYLAYTLSGGRSGAARTYGFDICASSACQVYAGVGLVEGPRGDRWAEAVRTTGNEILVYGGAPAQTFYHSTAGGRTEAIQDVWAGSDPVPYLQGAAAPGERSPFVDWTVRVPAHAFLEVLDAAGLGVGDELLGVEVFATAPGDGVWRALIIGSERTRSVDIGDIRAAMNRHGDELYPDLLPGVRGNGRRYPQPILSYRFDIEVVRPRPRVQTGALSRLLPDSDLPPSKLVIIEGKGWGHHIGMSQYGARALADAGLGYREILAHFYGGLQPVAGPDVLPREIAVGLAWGREEVALVLAGPVALEASGGTLLATAGGEWLLRSTRFGVGLIPPARVLPRLVTILRGNNAPL